MSLGAGPSRPGGGENASSSPVGLLIKGGKDKVYFQDALEARHTDILSEKELTSLIFEGSNGRGIFFGLFRGKGGKVGMAHELI